MKRLATWTFSVGVMLTGSQVVAVCTETGISVQILGSGGPFGDGRASSGYLVWQDGVSRLLVDAGGGTFSRFHEAEASIADLQLVALSHFHPDHSAELPALLWPLNGNLRIAGPSGSEGFPSLDDYLQGLFGEAGVFRVLNPRFTFDTVTVDVAGSAPSAVLEAAPLTVTATGVPHGDVPTLAYRVESTGRSVVFSSDQNGSDPNFIEFARGADVLVVHFAGNENSQGLNAQLHARPSVWGDIATAAGVSHLVLSHISINQDFEANFEVLREHYSGRLTVGNDLTCIVP